MIAVTQDAMAFLPAGTPSLAFLARSGAPALPSAQSRGEGLVTSAPLILGPVDPSQKGGRSPGLANPKITLSPLWHGFSSRGICLPGQTGKGKGK